MFEALGLTLQLTAIYSQLSVSRAVLVSVLVVLLAAAAHCILGTTAGAGTLTLTIPALSSLTQTQILYLTAGGLSTDTPTIYTVSISISTHPHQAWRLRAGWAPWRWPPPCWRMGAGAGPVEGTATAPRTGRDTRVCRIYVMK